MVLILKIKSRHKLQNIQEWIIRERQHLLSVVEKHIIQQMILRHLGSHLEKKLNRITQFTHQIKIKSS